MGVHRVFQNRHLCCLIRWYSWWASDQLLTVCTDTKVDLAIETIGFERLGYTFGTVQHVIEQIIRLNTQDCLMMVVYQYRAVVQGSINIRPKHSLVIENLRLTAPIILLEDPGALLPMLTNSLWRGVA